VTRHQTVQTECRINAQPGASELGVIGGQYQIGIEDLGRNLAGNEGNHNVTMLADWIGQTNGGSHL